MDEVGAPRYKRIRLTGERFEGGRLPVDSLVELEKYQRVLRIAAEQEWLHDHPGEVLPSDFDSSVSLTITSIEPGSADVFLAFEQVAIYETYQAEAQDAVDTTIAAAYAGEELPKLPSIAGDVGRDFRDAIARIGSTLEGTQSIEIYRDLDDANPLSITYETRKAAVQDLASVEDFLISPEPVGHSDVLQKQEEGLTGRIIAVDANKKRFTMETAVGEVHGWYRSDPTMLDSLKAVLNSAAEGPLTRVFGDLQYKGPRPFRFWDATSIQQVHFDDASWGARLTEFASLPIGWHDGAGAQITSEALDGAQLILRAIGQAAKSIPGVFPTTEGGVLLEWSTSDQITSVEILHDGEIELFRMNREEPVGFHSSTRDVAEAQRFAAEEGHA